MTGSHPRGSPLDEQPSAGRVRSGALSFVGNALRRADRRDLSHGAVLDTGRLGAAALDDSAMPPVGRLPRAHRGRRRSVHQDGARRPSDSPKSPKALKYGLRHSSTIFGISAIPIHRPRESTEPRSKRRTCSTRHARDECPRHPDCGRGRARPGRRSRSSSPSSVASGYSGAHLE